MARKRNVVINKEELQPTVLATIETKKKSVFGFVKMIFLFAIFIGLVYYLPKLPELSDLYNQYVLGIKPTKDDNVVKKVETSGKELDFSNDLVIENDNIKINNFTFSNGTISFDIQNKKDVSKNLIDSKYYLDFYNESNLIKSLKIAEDVFSASETRNYSFNINSNVITKVKFNELTIDDYPDVTISAKSNGDMTLICNKDIESVTYYFKDNKVNKINNIITLTESNSNYQELLKKYQTQIQLYKNIAGTNVVLNTDNGKVIFNIDIDLSKANARSFNNPYYYQNDTLAKVIKYEMESRDFQCS